MPLVFLGTLGLGTVAFSVDQAVAISLPPLIAEVSGSLSSITYLNAHPPTITGSLALAQGMVAGIQAAILVGVQVPSLSVQLAAINARLAIIQAQVTALEAFQTALTASGIHTYAYDGAANGLGPSVPASFPGGLPGDHVNALLIVVPSPSAWVSVGAVLKTS